MITFKNTQSFVKLLIFASAGLWFISCEPRGDLPDVPEIAFESYEILKNPVTNRDTGLILTISFVHGNALMGLDPDDTFPPFHAHDTNPYQNNIFIEYYEKTTDNFRQVRPKVSGIPIESEPFINYHGRFPDITPEGPNKALRGEIHRIITDDLRPHHSDTIRFKIWIVDRELNVSNSITTPEIVYKP
jgi:hypothetical protein